MTTAKSALEALAERHEKAGVSAAAHVNSPLYTREAAHHFTVAAALRAHAKHDDRSKDNARSNAST